MKQSVKLRNKVAFHSMCICLMLNVNRWGVTVQNTDLRLKGLALHQLQSSHRVHGHNVQFHLKLIYWLNPTNVVEFIWWLEQDESHNLSFGKKVARIGCKYDLSFPLYSCWALPSGGFAEGQLALRSQSLFTSRGIIMWETNAGTRRDKSIQLNPLWEGSVNLCRSSW